MDNKKELLEQQIAKIDERISTYREENLSDEVGLMSDYEREARRIVLFSARAKCMNALMDIVEVNELLNLDKENK